MELENRYGGYNTCDTDTYCDIYVTWAIAMADTAASARMPPGPDQTDYGNMRRFPDDPVSGRRSFRPGLPIFSSEAPVNEKLLITAWAHDKDKTSAWKAVFEAAGQIPIETAPAVAQIDPQAAGYTAIAGGVFKLAAAAIPNNGDDFMAAQAILLQSDGRWGTRSGVFDFDLQPINTKIRGPVRLGLVVDELPRS
jgi:hypothetical protein